MTPLLIDPLRDPDWHLGAVCERCKGNGELFRPSTDGWSNSVTLVRCSSCNTTGRIPWARVECPECEGKGKPVQDFVVESRRWAHLGPCPTCSGTGTAPVVLRLTVDVFAPVIRVQGEVGEGGWGIPVVTDADLATLFAQIATLHDVVRVVLPLDSLASMERAGVWQKDVDLVRAPRQAINKAIHELGGRGLMGRWPLPHVTYATEHRALAEGLGLAVEDG